MGKQILTFVDIEIEKDIIDITVLTTFPLVKISSDYKYLIGYLYDGFQITPIHIMLPQTSTYVKSY